MSDELLPVAILAGGLGQRLGPLTARVPKALMDVNGEPFIAHQLRLLQANGARRVVLCVGFLGESIEAVVGDGHAYGIEASFAWDGPGLRGTAGALKNALPLLGDAFLVLYGDSYLPCNYGQVQATFERSGKLALMTVFRNAGRWDASNVELVDGAIREYDKRSTNPRMKHIDYGLGVFRARALDNVPGDEPFDLATLYQELVRQDQLAACEVPERFYEIGSPAGLEETREHLTSVAVMDALRARAESASAHETELRALLLDAHEQLLRRDEVIAELRGTTNDNQGRSLLEERTLWAQRAVADVVRRDEMIRQLQSALEEQTAWAQRSAAEVAHRDAIIHQLQATARWSGAAVARLTLLQRTVPARLRSLVRERLRR